MRKVTLWLVALLVLTSFHAQTRAATGTVDVYKSLEKLGPGEKLVMKAQIFYSKPLRFDYDKDGVKNVVMMAARLFIKQRADGSYDGYAQRFLYDVDKKRPIRWYSKSNMLQEPPIAVDAKIKNVVVKNRTVAFDVGSLHFTMTDGGPGYIHDKIVVSDKIRTKTVKMVGGDVKVYNPPIGDEPNPKE